MLGDDTYYDNNTLNGLTNLIADTVSSTTFSTTNLTGISLDFNTITADYNLTSLGNTNLNTLNTTGNVIFNNFVSQSLGTNTQYGNLALNKITTGAYNTAVGYNSLGNLTTGSYNTAYGRSSLTAITSGSYNSAVGFGAGQSLTTSNYNILMGWVAGANLTTGISNTLLGTNSAVAVVKGSYNTFVGAGTNSTVDCSYSTCVGYHAICSGNNQTVLGNTIYNLTTYINANDTYISGNLTIGGELIGYDISMNGSVSTGALVVNGYLTQNLPLNQVIQYGTNTLVSNTTGVANCGIGINNLTNTTTGSCNTGVGNNVLTLNVSGTSNTAMGYDCNQNNTTGSQNTSYGAYSSWHNTTGSDNTNLGVNSNYNNISGNANTGVGSSSLLSNTSGSNNCSLGYYSLGSVLGNNNVGIGFNSLNSYGYYSDLIQNSGHDNTAIGTQAGSSSGVIFISGSYNTFLGSNTTTSVDCSYSTAIGAYATISKSNQTVIGNPAYNKSIDMNGDVSINNDLLILGNINGNVNVVGDVVFNRDFTILGSGNTYMSGTLTVAGDMDCYNPVFMTQSLDVTGVITSIGGFQSAGGVNYFQGGAYIGGEFNCFDVNTEGNLNVTGISILSGSTQLSSTLDVSGIATFGGATKVSSTLDISGNTTFGTFVNQTLGLSQSTSFGTLALNKTAGGTNNAAFGYNSLGSLTTGSYNQAFGRGALALLTTGSNNSAIGYSAGHALTTGGFNSFMGYYAGYNITTGTTSCYLGTNTGLGVIKGVSNTFVGVGADTTTDCSYSTCLGYHATCSGNNQMVLGNPSYNLSTYVNANDTYISGNTDISGVLYCSKNANFNGNVYILGSTDISGVLYCLNDASFNGNVNISGYTDMSGSLYCASDASFNRNVYIGNNLKCNMVLPLIDTSNNNTIGVISDNISISSLTETLTNGYDYFNENAAVSQLYSYTTPPLFQQDLSFNVPIAFKWINTEGVTGLNSNNTIITTNIIATIYRDGILFQTITIPFSYSVKCIKITTDTGITAIQYISNISFGFRPTNDTNTHIYNVFLQPTITYNWGSTSSAPYRAGIIIATTCSTHQTISGSPIYNSPDGLNYSAFSVSKQLYSLVSNGCIQSNQFICNNLNVNRDMTIVGNIVYPENLHSYTATSSGSTLNSVLSGTLTNSPTSVFNCGADYFNENCQNTLVYTYTASPNFQYNITITLPLAMKYISNVVGNNLVIIPSVIITILIDGGAFSTFPLTINYYGGSNCTTAPCICYQFITNIFIPFQPKFSSNYHTYQIFVQPNTNLYGSVSGVYSYTGSVYPQQAGVLLGTTYATHSITSGSCTFPDPDGSGYLATGITQNYYYQSVNGCLQTGYIVANANIFSNSMQCTNFNCPGMPGGWWIRSNSADNGAWFPLICSMSNLSNYARQDGDLIYVILPLYRILIYSNIGYSGLTQTIDNTGGGAPLVVPASSPNQASSYRFYYNGQEQTLAYLSF